MRRFDVVLAMVAVGSWFAAAYRWQHAVPEAENAAFALGWRDEMPSTWPERELNVRAGLLAERDPFSLDVFGDTASHVSSGRTSNPPSMPSARSFGLTLRAVVGGPPWNAILDGIPGEPPGTIVESGAVVGGLRIVSISPDAVVVVGGDSTWVLTVSRGGT